MRWVVAVLGVACWASACSGLTYRMELTQGELQERLDAKFPVEQDLVVVDVRLDDPEVTLREGSDRIGLGLGVWVSSRLAPRARIGKVVLSSKLDYSRETREVLLVQPRLEDLELSAVGRVYAEPIRRAVNLVLPILEGTPLTRIGADALGGEGAGWALKDVDVGDARVVVTLGR